MKEIIEIIEVYDKLRNTTIGLALATVIDVEGSSYRRTGARMLIQDNGIYTGGISGGCIEGNALKKAQLAIAGEKAMQVTYDTSKEDDEQIGVSLGCNGIISVLIAPIDYTDNQNPVEQLKSCIDDREPNVLITVIEADDGINIEAGQVFRFVSEAGLKNSLGKAYQDTQYDDIKKLLGTEKSKVITYINCKLFLEFIPPAIQIIILGGNYDVYPLLKITNSMGWRNIIVANPRRLANKIQQLADRIEPDFDEITIDQYTVGILMSHDYNADFNNLKKALGSDLRYIGLLGPASRKSDLLAKLPFQVDKNHKNRLFGPAGLDIGASQPEEIAISIISEILSVMRNRPGTSLRNRQGPIYTR